MDTQTMKTILVFNTGVGFNMNEYWSKRTIPMTTFTIPKQTNQKAKETSRKLWNIIQNNKTF
jgi:hypothetical protein